MPRPWCPEQTGWVPAGSTDRDGLAAKPWTETSPPADTAPWQRRHGSITALHKHCWHCSTSTVNKWMFVWSRSSIWLGYNNRIGFLPICMRNSNKSFASHILVMTVESVMTELCFNYFCTCVLFLFFFIFLDVRVLLFPMQLVPSWRSGGELCCSKKVEDTTTIDRKKKNMTYWKRCCGCKSVQYSEGELK